ncbi:MAG TPA: type II toxin-antitoxin system VapB family antitoxin [Steroidobacter sp.]|uniref:type II toxin-antitoxin system VapB family antitoxin n=1 Tax=Steroidobacter sp. TaxID=1978227 RepID=UPI002EDAB687
MATNLSIDPELMELALKVGGEKTKAATVTKALQEFIAHRRQNAMLDLAGRLEWDSQYDYKRDKSRR